MLEITVKTIDGQNRSYSIPDNYTVKQFKEKIAGSMNIPVDRQRLIFQGRVLKDEKPLNEFDINGKTLHLVERTPPTTSTTTTTTQADSTRSQASSSATANNGGMTEETNIFIGGFPLGAASNTNTTGSGGAAGGGIQSFIQQFINGLTNDFGGQGVNITQTSGPGGANNRNIGEIQIDLGNMSQSMNEEEIRNRISNVRKLLNLARLRLNRLREIQSGAPLEDIFPTAQLSQMMQVDEPVAQTPQPQVSTESTPQPQVEPQNLTVSVLAELITSVNTHYMEFQPYLLEYQSLLANDATEPVETDSGENRRQRFCNNINDMMHLMGHLFHNISDLHVNLRERPPRSMRTMAPFQTAAIMTATPYEANIQIPITMTMPNATSQTSTTTTSTGSTSTTTTTTTTTTRVNPPLVNTTTTQSNPLATAFNLGQPVTYLEYGPNAITLNQISAQIVNDFSPSSTPPPAPTTGSTTTTASDASTTQAQQQQQQQPGGSFSQSIQSLANYIIRRTVGSGAADVGTPTNTENTTTTGGSNLRSRSTSASRDGTSRATSYRRIFNNPRSSSTSSSTSNLQQPQLPGMQSSSFGTFDPFLPCNSVHFLNSTISVQPVIIPTFQRIRVHNNNAHSNSTRRRHPAGNQRTTSAATTTVPVNSATDATGARTTIGDLFGSILRGQNATTTTTTNTTSTQSTPTSPLNNFNDLLNLFATPNTTTPNTTTPQAQNEQQQFLDTLRQTFNALNTNNPNDERLNTPLSNLLNTSTINDATSSTSSTSTSTSNNYLIEIFYTLFSSMTVINMLNLVMGHNTSDVFTRAKQPLRDLINIKLLKTSSTTEITTLSAQNLTILSNLISDDLLKDLNAYLNDNKNQIEYLNEHIDFYQSFESLFLFYIKKFLTHIYDNSTDAVAWSNALYVILKEFRDQIIALFRYTFKNADEILINFLCLKLDHINGNTAESSSSPAAALFSDPLNNFFSTFTRSTLSDILTSIQPSSDVYLRFVINKQASLASRLDSEEQLIELPSLSTSSVESSVSSSNESTPSISNDGDNTDWRNVVPNEWIKIIENDIEKQQRQKPNENDDFSEAYASGMPAKKKK